MSMAYTRVNWQDGPSGGTPLSAANLNVMDQGIADAHADLDAATASPASNELIRRDANGRAQVAAPTESAHICTKGYADGLGTPAEIPDSIVRRDGNGRFQAAHPVGGNDVATRDYVDIEFGPWNSLQISGCISGLVDVQAAQPRIMHRIPIFVPTGGGIRLRAARWWVQTNHFAFDGAIIVAGPDGSWTAPTNAGEATLNVPLAASTGAQEITVVLAATGSTTQYRIPSSWWLWLQVR